MENLTRMDLGIVALYLVFMLVIGVLSVRKIKNAEDYFVAGRSLGLFTMIATVCATIIGGGALIGRGGVVYDRGVMAVWLAIPYFIGMVAFSFIAKRINRLGKSHGVSSIPDLMEKRYGKSVKLIFSLLIAYTMMATVGSQISATATIIKIVGVKWNISYEIGALIATAIFIIYTSASGLFGVVYTDVAQCLILIVSVYVIVPIVAVSKVGSLAGLFSQIPGEMLEVLPDASFAGYIFTNLLFSFAGAEMWQRAFASKDGGVAKKGIFFGTMAYGVTILVTLVLGLCAYVLLPDLLAGYGTTDAAVPALILACLPIGLRGLAIAGLLGVMMSSSDSYLLVSIQTIIGDIVKSWKPQISQETELKLSRLITPLLGFGALIIALYIKRVYEALMFAWTFYAASVGLPAFAALYWKRATKAGVVSAVLAGFGSSCLWHALGSPRGLADSLVGGVVCLIALVCVSLCTYQPGRYPRLE